MLISEANVHGILSEMSIEFIVLSTLNEIGFLKNCVTGHADQGALNSNFLINLTVRKVF